MKPRLVFVSLLTGLLASQILSFVFKDIWPGYIESGFAPTINPDLAWAGYVVFALLLLMCGYVSARLEWAERSKDAMQIGATAGLLSGSLAYLLSYAPAASGLMGQKEILLSISRTTISEQEGLNLLIQGIVNTIVWVQVSFWVFMLGSIILGAFGGLLSRLETSGGWGKEPAFKAPFLFQLTVYGLVSFAVFNLVIIVATLGIMPDLIERTMLQTVGAADGLLMPPWATLAMPLITATVFIVVCLVLIMQWAFESWRNPENRFRMKVWLAVLALVVLPLIVSISYPLAWMFLGMLLVIGLLLWLRRRLQPSAPEKESVEPQPYTILDILASALTQGIIISSVGVGSLIAQSLTLVFITVVSIPHLTNSGQLESTALEQITSLYTISNVQNLVFFLVSCIAGLIVAAVGIWVRTLSLKSQRQPLELI